MNVWDLFINKMFMDLYINYGFIFNVNMVVVGYMGIFVVFFL